MGPAYYEQIKKYLEPDVLSTHSKSKSIAANSHQGSLRSNTIEKVKPETVLQRRAHGSFGSFDGSVHSLSK